jgi:hypothetical protein
LYLVEEVLGPLMVGMEKVGSLVVEEVQVE